MGKTSKQYELELDSLKKRRSELNVQINEILKEMMTRRAGYGTLWSRRVPVHNLQLQLDRLEAEADEVTAQIKRLTKQYITDPELAASCTNSQTTRRGSADNHMEECARPSEKKLRQRTARQWLKRYYDMNQDSSLLCEFYLNNRRIP